MRLLISFFLLFSFLFSSDFYRKVVLDCDYMYSIYKHDYHSSSYKRIGRFDCSDWAYSNVDLTSSNYYIESNNDIESAKIFADKTAKVACEHSSHDLPLFFKDEYCKQYVFKQIPSLDNNKLSFKDSSNFQTSSFVPSPDLSKKYKNSPQLVTDKLHLYNVTNISFFRDKKDVLFIESSSGNYAIPLSVVLESKKINFTNFLTSKIPSL